ncbi:MAG: substrate-binding domain-containing protein [Lachnospiraceae bacterium]|nr:substrate-binding domain-containing protein [Lachnospiraceae bacterium]
MKRNATMADIAKKVGVSIVTVSKALSGKSGVSEKLREEICRTAGELEYGGRQKKRQESKPGTIGVIAAERFLAESRSYYWRLYQEITLAAKKRHMFTLLEVVNHEAENAGSMPKLLQKNVDGLIIMGAFAGSYLERLNEAAKMPLIALDSVYEKINADAVNADNIEGGYRMTEYLIREGFSRIGYVGTLRTTPSIDDRYMGYCKAMLFGGFSVRGEWLVGDRDIASGIVDAEGSFVLPQKEDMPQAFFCNSDVSAQILVRKLKELGYRVPEDISVAGFDHYLPERTSDLDFTTYEVDAKGMACEAIELLLKRLTGYCGAFRTLTVRGKIVEGNSVKRL